MKIGKRLKEKRKQMGFSQNKLAEVLHVDRSLISKWENDIVEPPEYMVKQIVEALNISASDLCSSSIENEGTEQSVFEKDDVAFLLLMIISLQLRAWGLPVILMVLIETFRKKASAWIRILCIFIILFLICEILQ